MNYDNKNKNDNNNHGRLSFVIYTDAFEESMQLGDSIFFWFWHAVTSKKFFPLAKRLSSGFHNYVLPSKLGSHFSDNYNPPSCVQYRMFAGVA